METVEIQERYTKKAVRALKQEESELALYLKVMERVLRGVAWSECLVYLDDILVFGPDFGTTLARLESVLDRFS